MVSSQFSKFKLEKIQFKSQTVFIQEISPTKTQEEREREGRMKKSLNLFYISKTSRVRCKIQSNFLTRKELNGFVFCIFELGFLYLFDVNGFQSKLDLALNKPQS